MRTTSAKELLARFMVETSTYPSTRRPKRTGTRRLWILCKFYNTLSHCTIPGYSVKKGDLSQPSSIYSPEEVEFTGVTVFC